MLEKQVFLSLGLVKNKLFKERSIYEHNLKFNQF